MTTSEQLREQHREWEAHNDSAWDGVISLKAAEELEALKGLLVKLEWSGTSVGGYHYCPSCESAHENGHTDTCELAKAIHS